MMEINKHIGVSVPGSVMLLGEHAVLHGYPAVVSAVDYHMTVSLSPRDDDRMSIRSILGLEETTLSQLTIKPPFLFVLTSIKNYQHLLKTGFDIEITANFSHELGLGSSAAVTVAIVTALRKYLALPTTPLLIYADALRVIHQVQGMGSGADVAASVYGGVLAYSIHPLKIEVLPSVPHLSLFYSGSKTPTAEVLRKVKKAFEHRPEELNRIYQTIGNVTKQGIDAIKNQDWQKLGECFTLQQKSMDELGVTNAALQSWLDKLSQEKKVLGVKISGAGLGDCVIALGDLSRTAWLQERDYIAVS